MAISDIFIFFGGQAALLAVFAYLFNRVADRFNIKWKETADANNAILQGEIQKNNSYVASLLSMYGASHQQAQERRIKAIEILWTNLANLKQLVPNSVAGIIYSVFNEDQLKDFWSKDTDNENYNSMRSDLANLDFFNHAAKKYEFAEKVEMERPF